MLHSIRSWQDFCKQHHASAGSTSLRQTKLNLTRINFVESDALSLRQNFLIGLHSPAKNDFDCVEHANKTQDLLFLWNTSEILSIWSTETNPEIHCLIWEALWRTRTRMNIVRRTGNQGGGVIAELTLTSCAQHGSTLKIFPDKWQLHVNLWHRQVIFGPDKTTQTNTSGF